MSNTEIEYNGRFNEKEVCLVSVRELLFQSKSFEFLIPSYQRGYRWGKLQVKQFITDILNEIDGYCIQVLTIKKIIIKINMKLLMDSKGLLVYL